MIRYWPEGTDERTLARLRGALGARFERLGVQGEDIPLTTPATTGLWLLRASGAPMQALPDDVRQLIVATACQHRIEFHGLGLPAQGTIPALYYYDGRAMYLGLTDAEVGQGPCEVVTGGDLLPEYRGRVCVAFAVPAGWTGPGLLPVPRAAGGYDWPRRPGEHGSSWCSFPQARLAAAQGWHVVPVQQMRLAPGQPLRAWGGRLATQYRWSQMEQGAAVLAACYRAICLHAIGALHRTERREKLRSLEPSDLAAVRPGDSLEVGADGSWAVRETAYRLDRWEPSYSHPEWSAGIWSACQYRITRALLEAQPGSVLGVWGDAIYTTTPLADASLSPGGELGRLRLKRHVEGPLPAPHSWADLRALLEERP